MVHVQMANVCVKWDGVENYVNSKHVHMNVIIMEDVNLEYVSATVDSKENIAMKDMSFMVN